MIRKFRNSIFGKCMSIIMLLVFVLDIIPFNRAYALTGGPAQPEFNAFTPIGTSDMVDLASGDFSYNIPLIDVGGFPINLAYNSGITMDQEASWVGLGWNLSIGQINRQMRGVPDDFDGSKGDKLRYENNIKDNYTVGGSFSVPPGIFGAEFDVGQAVEYTNPDFTIGLSAEYNSYTGFSMSPSAGVSYDFSEIGSVGLNGKSTPNGLVLQPSLSLHHKWGGDKKNDNSINSTIGVTFNSRQGLSNINMSASYAPKKDRILQVKNTKGGLKKLGVGSSISFLPNHYTPSVEDAMNTTGYTFNGALGTEAFGVEGSIEVTGFISNQSLLVNDKEENVYGYENTHKATQEDVLDFNREKDGNFSVNTTNLPLTNYTYDIYSVQGQGVAGTFRPYRSQIGFVADNKSVSISNAISQGAEVGTAQTVHVGADMEVTNTDASSGVWKENNEALEQNFLPKPGSFPEYEEVYFKNVGDLSADIDIQNMYGTANSGLGGLSPVKPVIEGTPYKRKLSNKYKIKYIPNSNSINGELQRSKRQKRNQNIQKIIVEELIPTNQKDLIGFNFNPNAKHHHTAGYIITRSDGARYIYGEALYNTVKKEATFALGNKVGHSGLTGNVNINQNCAEGLVEYDPGVDNSIDNNKGDKYFNRITTPAYAHTYLLTALVSNDYSDVDNIEGPSVNDLGSYTLFEYQTPISNYKWRIPYQENQANYNEGLKTNTKDDKGSYVYGEKELRYIEKIETKTHVAIFDISERHDAHGVIDENGGRDDAMDMFKLDKITLYSRGEYYEDDGFTPANSPTPIKTVHFEYDYSLCPDIINNDGNPEYNNQNVDINADKGKLTLKKVYFTYRDSKMGKYSPYEFVYNSLNPNYNLKGYDVWGCYKENNGNTTSNWNDPLTPPEFMYTDQEDAGLDQKMSAWSLTDIELPSGGKIEIDYESDDYQFIQNRKAMRMFKLAGCGTTQTPGEVGNKVDFHPDPSQNGQNQTKKEGLLYAGLSDQAAKYLYFELPAEDNSISEADFKEKYLDQIKHLQSGLVQFRCLMNMNPGGGKTISDNYWKNNGEFDYVSGYFNLDYDNSTVFDYGGTTYGSVAMQLVSIGDNGPTIANPLSKAGWHFGRRYLSEYIYGFPDQDEGLEPSAAIEMVLQSIDNLKELFMGGNGVLLDKEIARRMIPEKSWIRLSNPNGFKKGGGCRVREIRMSDNWDQMTTNTNETQDYGQAYKYVLVDEDGIESSSGVATYEPAGAKDNPIIQPVFSHENRLLAPDEENYMEKPFGESFFPNPTVTYSRVEVKNLERKDDNNTPGDPQDDEIVKSNATGKVVTEFYTSKDFPTIVDQTPVSIEEDHNPLIQNLLKVSVKKHITMSQGYMIHLNDMNGKMKSERVYAEDQSVAISGVDYKYDVNPVQVPQGINDNAWLSTNIGRLDNEVKVLFPDGTIKDEKLGIEYDVINDFREMKSVTKTGGVHVNTATFIVGPAGIVVPVPIPKFARHENKLNMATTTKVINSFGILRETVAHDVGASVSTRNLLWDASTGEVLLTETVNEYGDKYYSLNFPAHWYYEGMGQAAENSGLEISASYNGSTFTPSSGYAENLFTNGDEVIIKNDYNKYAWVTEVSGNSFNLIKEDGTQISNNNVDLKIVRSGKRNVQSSQMASVVLQHNPLTDLNGSLLPSIALDWLSSSNFDHKIINAGAVEFSDEWPIQCECTLDNTQDPINPYLYNQKGVWRALTSHLYLTGRQHHGTNNTDKPDLRGSGFYTSFSPYYKFDDVNNEWIKDGNGWKNTSDVTKFSPYGFEVENKDALDRFSAAQYGYNYSFPLAVGANTEYREMGFDGFEDYFFNGCPGNEHFGFRDVIDVQVHISDEESHTGKFSIKLTNGETIERFFNVEGN